MADVDLMAPALDGEHTVTARALRKAEHIALALELAPATESSIWTDVQLVHDALPDTDFDSVDVSGDLLGKSLGLPLVIAGMTGGFEGAEAINRTLARAAQHHRLAVGVGSQRAALARPDLVSTYAVVREEAPDAVVIANVGINQLIAQDSAAALSSGDVLRAVEMVGADALAVHLNYLEEVVQPEGQTRARGAAQALHHLIAYCPVPVIAKETGCGLSAPVARRLAELGVSALDVGGHGGTSFTAIEAARASAQGDTRRAQIGATFAEWGVPTTVSVIECAPVLPTIATGGVRSGLDAAKALALGAVAVGVGRPLLERGLTGDDAVDEWLEIFAAELRTAIFLAGVSRPSELRSLDFPVLGRTREWITSIGVSP